MCVRAVTRLAWVGDVGIGGAIAILLLPLNAKRRYGDMGRFLDSARTLTVALSVICGGLILALSPWLPGWLEFKDLPGTGSLALLFAVGALGIAASIVAMINFGNCCCLLGIPIGIWSLVILMQPDVKAAFDQNG